MSKGSIDWPVILGSSSSPRTSTAAVISRGCLESRSSRTWLSSSEKSVTSKTPAVSENCTKAMRWPFLLLSSRLAVTMPARRFMPGSSRAARARSAEEITLKR